MNDLDNDLTNSQFMPYRRNTNPVPILPSEPNERAISNVVNIEFPGNPDSFDFDLSALAWDFLQFVDHDVVGALLSEEDCPPIPVPECDPWQVQIPIKTPTLHSCFHILHSAL